MKIYYWMPVVILMGVIFFLSSRQRISVSETYEINFLFFKTLHVLEYALLFLISYRAVKYGSSVKRKKIGITAFFITVVYAISDELHQTFVPTREGHIRDVIIDTFGALLAWISLYQILPKLPKKLKILVDRWHLI